MAERILKCFFLGPFVCEKCNKEYRYRSSLRSHVTYECGKAPKFQCHICPYKTKKKGNLKIHVLGQHSGKFALHKDTN